MPPLRAAGRLNQTRTFSADRLFMRGPFTARSFSGHVIAGFGDHFSPTELANLLR